MEDDLNMGRITDLYCFIRALFGYSSAEEQTEATNEAIAWAFVIGLVSSAVLFFPFPLNAIIIFIVLAWVIGRLRHYSDTFNAFWGWLTLRKLRLIRRR